MITLGSLTEILGWSLLINIVILLASTIGLVVMRETISELHSRLFGLDKTDLGRAYFQYLAQYKTAVMVLNLAPYIALKLMGQ